MVVVASTALGCPAEDVDHERAEQRARAELLVTQHCESVAECECSKTESSAGCEPTLTETWSARIQAGSNRGLTYDEACFDTIEAGIEDARCGWPPGDQRNPCHDHCQIFHGNRNEGQSCTRFDDLVSDCEQGLLCDGDRCVAPCSRLSGLPEGATCLDVDTFTPLDRCADGLTCISGSGTCRKAPAAGEQCFEGECDPDSYCDFDDGAAQSLCRTRVGAGGDCDFAPCAIGFECTYIEGSNGSYEAQCRAEATEGMPCFEVGCVDGLDCSANGLCVAPVGEGQSCYDIDCEEGLICDFDGGMICRALPKAGAACLFGECENGSFCELEVCVPGLPLAQACTGHRQCESGFCPAGFCDRRPQLGDSCADALACDVGASCDGAVCRASVARGPAVCVYEGW